MVNTQELKRTIKEETSECMDEKEGGVHKDFFTTVGSMATLKRRSNFEDTQRLSKAMPVDGKSRNKVRICEESTGVSGSPRLNNNLSFLEAKKCLEKQ